MTKTIWWLIDEFVIFSTDLLWVAALHHKSEMELTWNVSSNCRTAPSLQTCFIATRLIHKRNEKHNRARQWRWEVRVDRVKRQGGCGDSIWGRKERRVDTSNNQGPLKPSIRAAVGLSAIQSFLPGKRADEWLPNRCTAQLAEAEERDGGGVGGGGSRGGGWTRCWVSPAPPEKIVTLRLFQPAGSGFAPPPR